MALADVVQEAQRPHSQVYADDCRAGLTDTFVSLQEQVEAKIIAQGIPKAQIRFEYFLNMRYKGTETAMMIRESSEAGFKSGFLRRHLQEFNFVFPDDRPILIDDIRVRGIGGTKETTPDAEQLSHELRNLTFSIVAGKISNLVGESMCSMSLAKIRQRTVYFQGQGAQQSPVHVLQSLAPGNIVEGPAIILDETQTLVIAPGAKAKILTSHVVIDVSTVAKAEVSDQKVDPATLSTFGHRFMSIAEQMGRALQNTSVSLNIKERLDFSCAIFGPDGGCMSLTLNVELTICSWTGGQRTTRAGTPWLYELCGSLSTRDQ
jgi:5-oxoprolinase (ATP-hydrolysing)